MDTSLKAAWEVRGGLVPRQPMTEYSSTFLYTSDDHARDGGREGPIYQQRKRQAHEAAQALEAGGLNWVAIEYIWL